jgi:Uma2 family endonuclease
MAIASLISIDEYLNTSYEPDCDFVDGSLEERNLGKLKHSRLQIILAAYLFSREKQLGIYAITEQRIRVAGKRVRIPDICVLLNGQPRAEVIDVPPFLCVEILSPDDTLAKMMARINDYLAFGVPNIWVIDPDGERSYFATAAGLMESHENILRTADPEIVVPVFELFENL